MRAMRKLLPILLVGACGGGEGGLSGGENSVGTYQVTLHQRNVATSTSIACTDFGPAVAEEMYIKILEDDFFEDPNFLAMETCDTDPADCFPSIVHFEAYGDHILSEGWSHQDCALSASRNYGFLTGTTIRIERQEWYFVSEGDCDLEAAEALIGTPDCEMNEAWEATRM